jgi:hypothetical protein
MKEDDPLQLAIDKLYIKLCEEGDIENLKGFFQLYRPKKTSANPIFSYFLNITQHFKASIDLHCQDDDAFKKACKNSHTEVLDYLIKFPNFVKNINNNKHIYYAFQQALISENIPIAKYIHSLMKKNSNYHNVLYDGFTNSCYRGKLESVKYLLTEPSIDRTSRNNWLTHLSGTQPTLLAGFIAACEGSGGDGHVNIVKYLTSLEPKLNFNELQRHLNINNIEIMQHFIFDLDLNRNDTLIKRIYYKDSIELNKLFEKKELFQNLNSDLNPNDDSSLNQPKKKLKL